jgi:hypothetical protein
MHRMSTSSEEVLSTTSLFSNQSEAIKELEKIPYSAGVQRLLAQTSYDAAKTVDTEFLEDDEKFAYKTSAFLNTIIYLEKIVSPSDDDLRLMSNAFYEVGKAGLTNTKALSDNKWSKYAEYCSKATNCLQKLSSFSDNDYRTMAKFFFNQPR